MPNSAPIHLHFTNHLDENENFIPSPFLNEELIYRSFKENNDFPREEYFSGISSEEIARGISINRGSYCKSHLDVLWRNEHEPIDHEIPSCNYTLRGGDVIYSIYEKLINSIPPHAIVISINSSWVKCNVAHCDIILTPNISTLNKKEKRVVRIYIASLFKELV